MMSRKLISVLISLFAVAFAFAAMAAIRWPTIMMVVTVAFHEEAMAGVDWRAIGLFYGAPYFIASLCLYAAAVLVARRSHGAFGWYVTGCLAGFPCAYLVDFEPGWWRDPGIGEGAVAGAGVIALLLAVAVWDLRRRRPKRVPAALSAAVPDEAAPVPVQVAAPAPSPKPKRRPAGGPFPAAIAANRARFARDGARMLARQRRYR